MARVQNAEVGVGDVDVALLLHSEHEGVAASGLVVASGVYGLHNHGDWVGQSWVGVVDALHNETLGRVRCRQKSALVSKPISKN